MTSFSIECSVSGNCNIGLIIKGNEKNNRKEIVVALIEITIDYLRVTLFFVLDLFWLVESIVVSFAVEALVSIRLL